MVGNIHAGSIARRLTNWGGLLTLAGIAPLAAVPRILPPIVEGIAAALLAEGLLLLLLAGPSRVAVSFRPATGRPAEFAGPRHAFDRLGSTGGHRPAKLPSVVRLLLSTIAAGLMLASVGGVIRLLTEAAVDQWQLAGALSTLGLLPLLGLKLDRDATDAAGLFTWGVLFSALAVAVALALKAGLGAFDDTPHIVALLSVTIGFALVSLFLAVLLGCIWSIADEVVARLIGEDEVSRANDDSIVF